MTNSVTFPVNLGGDGSTVTDDDNASTGLGNGGHRTRFVPAMGQVVAVANVLTQRLASNSDTSSSSVAIGTGNKTFVTAGFYEWAVGMWVTVTSAANPANYMFGQVTSWTTSTNTVIVDIDSVGGSGTLSDWTIALSSYSFNGDYLTDADIGVTVQPYDADTPTVAATQAEMQSGTETAIRSMSPLRVAEAIGALVSGRNKIINGAMMIDQRNAGASVAITTSDNYITDRFVGIVSANSKLTGQQNAGSVTPPVGFVNYLGMTVAASANVTVGATDLYVIGQQIEGLNCSDLAWGTASAATVTLSFWVRSSITGTFGGSLRNSGPTRSYPFTYTISAANTWEQKSVTIAGDTSGTWLTTNGIGIRLLFGLGVGSTYSGTAGSWAGANYVSATGATKLIETNGATFYITGVQLEKGASATPFENRLYGTELALCQRYCQIVSRSTASLGFLGTKQAGNYLFWHMFYNPMRASPTWANPPTTWDNSGTPGTTSSAAAYDLVNSAVVTISGSLSTTNQLSLNQGRVYLQAGTSFSGAGSGYCFSTALGSDPLLTAEL